MLCFFKLSVSAVAMAFTVVLVRSHKWMSTTRFIGRHGFSTKSRNRRHTDKISRPWDVLSSAIKEKWGHFSRH